MVSLSRKTLRAAQVAPQRCPIPRTGKRRIIIPWIIKSSIAQFAPEDLLSDFRTGCSMSTGQAAPRHRNNRAVFRTFSALSLSQCLQLVSYHKSPVTIQSDISGLLSGKIPILFFALIVSDWSTTVHNKNMILQIAGCIRFLFIMYCMMIRCSYFLPIMNPRISDITSIPAVISATLFAPAAVTMKIGAMVR